MTFSHKKDDIKQTLKSIVFMLFAHSFLNLMWNYCNIKVYLKTLMLGGINRDSFQKNVWLVK